MVVFLFESHIYWDSSGKCISFIRYAGSRKPISGLLLWHYHNIYNMELNYWGIIFYLENKAPRL